MIDGRPSSSASCRDTNFGPISRSRQLLRGVTAHEALARGLHESSISSPVRTRGWNLRKQTVTLASPDRGATSRPPGAITVTDDRARLAFVYIRDVYEKIQCRKFSDGLRGMDDTKTCWSTSSLTFSIGQEFFVDGTERAQSVMEISSIDSTASCVSVKSLSPNGPRLENSLVQLGYQRHRVVCNIIL